MERVHSRLIHDLTREIEQPTTDWYTFVQAKLTEWNKVISDYVSARKLNPTAAIPDNW